MPVAPCLVVLKVLGEKAISTMKKLDLLNLNLKVGRKGDYIFIPLSRDPSREELEEIRQILGDVTLSHFDFLPKVRGPKSLIDVLEAKMPAHLLASLPRSFDTVGGVAIVEIPPELWDRRSLIGEAILGINKNIHTVLAKAGVIHGVYRTREFEIIAGVGKTEVVHKEHGCIYYIDVMRAYFSPRLSYEHERVSRQVEEGEVVLDMFAGVGPFSILIAKNHGDVKVYAIDINPDAVRYLKRNILANKVENKVIPLLGDARKIIDEKLKGTADRVIMNLPERGIEYVDSACEAVKAEGGIVHYYEFSAEPDAFERARMRLWEAVSTSGREVRDILNVRSVRPTAPHEFQVVVDALIC